MFEDVFANQLYYTYQKNTQVHKSPIGILIGDEGTGKTTVFSLLTNHSSQASSNSDQSYSTTRALFFSCPSKYGESFQIMDTPGIGADYEDDRLTLEHVLRQVLLEGPLSRIFFFLKYERFGPMVKKLSEQLIHLEPYKNLLTIVVTCWDREDTAENRQVFANAKKKMLDYDNELPDSFIFIGKDATSESACQAFYNCLSIGQPSSLESQTGKPLQDCTIENLEILKKYIDAFADTYNSFQAQMQADKNSNKGALQESFIIRIAQKAQDILGEFAKDDGSEMTELDCYRYSMQLKAQFIPMIENIRQLEYAKKEIIPNQVKSDPKDRFKACPYCNLIWAKVPGSDGQTQCMIRYESKTNVGHPIQNQIISTRSSHNANTSWTRKITNFFKSFLCCWDPADDIQIDQFQNASLLTQNTIGCGRSFNWIDQPAINQETYDRFKAAGFIEYFESCQEEQLHKGAISIHEIENRMEMTHGIQ